MKGLVTRRLLMIRRMIAAWQNVASPKIMSRTHKDNISPVVVSSMQEVHLGAPLSLRRHRHRLALIESIHLAN